MQPHLGGAMPLGLLLIRENLIDPIQLAEARYHQKTAGGDLISSLLTLELISPSELDAFLGYAPSPPTSFEATGLDAHFLLDFLMKAVYLTGHETIPQLSEFTKLPSSVITSVFESASNLCACLISALITVSVSLLFTLASIT